jgi:hypothetical protein
MKIEQARGHSMLYFLTMNDLSAIYNMLNPHPSLSYWQQITKIWDALDWSSKKSDDFK